MKQLISKIAISNVILPLLFVHRLFQSSLDVGLRKWLTQTAVVGTLKNTCVRDNRRTRLHSFSLNPSNIQILCLFALIILHTQCDSLGWKDHETPRDPRKFNGAGRRNQLFFPPTPVGPCYGPMTTGTYFLTIKSDPRTRDTVPRDLSKVARHLPRQLALDASTRAEYMYKFAVAVSPFISLQC